MNFIKKYSILFSSLFICVMSSPVKALDLPKSLINETQKSLNTYFQAYKDQEYFSGGSLSIYIPGYPISNFYVGNISHENNSAKVSAETLFQIGSITKSFTAVTVLQLENEGKLSIHDTLGKWLPEYDKWSSIKIDALLNMTSNLPNYSDSPFWNTEESLHPQTVWKHETLIDFVYPKKLNPPLSTGYFYSNTGYILVEMIIEKLTRESFQTILTNKIFRPLNLTNTFYPIPTMDKAIQERVAHGYGFNQYDNPELVGKDVTLYNLSWASAAGGIVSTTEDVIKWIKALFIETNLLDASQKAQITSMASTTTGKPIKNLSSNDPQGFGLGIIQRYSQNSKPNRFWFYEGKTLGYRAAYLYDPSNGVIISIALNSVTHSKNDHIPELMQKIYSSIVQNTLHHKKH